MLYLTIKWLHILSSTVLFGTGVGTAFFMLMAHRSGDVRAIAWATRTVVLADWLFTTPSVIFQPLSGLMLVHLAQYPMTATWLVAALILYGFAGACWLPVVWLQLRMRRLAAKAVTDGTGLPDAYYRDFRRWFMLGCLAFPAVIAIFWLMVTTPN
ncbi:MAG TPA: DUF2269 domain-containing protein [Asticcacaulis sp.]|nr:DUF2269 domain-containing protein [Asticcacaulis sp.]